MLAKEIMSSANIRLWLQKLTISVGSTLRIQPPERDYHKIFKHAK